MLKGELPVEPRQIPPGKLSCHDWPPASKCHVLLVFSLQQRSVLSLFGAFVLPGAVGPRQIQSE